MSGPTSRALALLDLLQTARQWPGRELADRLGTTERTLRRDVDRLRELGYRVSATRGAGGGYRLEAGAALPPLLLTDDEAVATALGLRAVATAGLVDGETTTLTALAKLEQVLPLRLRRRVRALADHVQPQTNAPPRVAPDVLGQLALACRDRERVRFHYVAASGVETDRLVEPHSLVAAARCWFVVGWDRDRRDWRTFRADRASRLLRTGVRDPARVLPAADAAAFVRDAVRELWRGQHTVEIVLSMSLEEFRRWAGRWAERAEAADAGTTVWTVRADSPAHVLAALAWIPERVGYELRGAPRLLDAVAVAAEGIRARAAAAGSSDGT